MIQFCKFVHEIAEIWTAEEPPIQRFLIFTGKTKQEHHEANGPPRNPNYVLLSLILIYWYGCAKLFAAARVVQDWAAFYHHGCRDAGTRPCMNMLWSHALLIQVFHVKTFQPSLNLRFFGHETMSVDLSIGLCCVISDKRHCLHFFWFEAGSTTAKKAQLSQLLHRHTVPTGKKNILVASIFDRFHFT